ncbi:MAG: TonB-dependent receptor [Candidatus Marinimicrobia bacterium]|nr:TonB-dependent receptor [Candidatus Neomarinimicrobiota bacterium]
MSSRNKFIILFVILTTFMSTLLQAQTGKISGRVIDESTGDPLMGVNVVVKGGTGILGAATDFDGNYYVINVPPGTYMIEATMIGYAKVTVNDVVVNINRTTNIPVSMKLSVIEGETVVVEASKIKIKKDQTSTVKNIGADQISTLPVESVDQVVGMQAGVVNGHFRGGRNTEVSYMIDGMQVNESFGGATQTVEIDPDAVQDLEVITGIFNAEYGQAMSGIVNMVTKEGGNEFKGKLSTALSNFVTSDENHYMGLDPLEFDRNKDISFMLEGPIIKDRLTFFTNVRYIRDNGYLNGQRLFNVDDYSDMSRKYRLTGRYSGTQHGVYEYEMEYYRNEDIYKNMSFKEYEEMTLARYAEEGITPFPIYYQEMTGDGDYVPMSWNEKKNVLAKFTYKVTSKLKLNFKTIYNQNEYQNYSFGRRFRPDGRAVYYDNSLSNSLIINHMLSTKMYYELKAGYTNNIYENYLYKDPTDDRYINGNYGTEEGGYYKRVSANWNFKGDFIWQVNKNHNIKTGFEGIVHRIENKPLYAYNTFQSDPAYYDSIWYDIEKDKVYFKDEISWNLELLPDSSISLDRYTKKPMNFSAYIQDKMEFDDLTINLGFRYDYFDPATTYPTNYRNPNNSIYYADSLREERYSSYPEAEPTHQMSPRLGLSYALGSTAALHFGYGHFFQTPPFYRMYTNDRHLISTTDFSTTMGNPNIEPEKTVQYEFGLQQQLADGLILDVSLFYNDVYNLSTVLVRSTYNDIKYGLYGNKDYANKKGLEVKLNYFKNEYSFDLNYTLQYTRANADNPTQTFTAAGNNIDPVPKLIPNSWDQRHTLNFTLGYNKANYGMNLVGYYGSGARYTWTPHSESRLSSLRLYENNSQKPYTLSFDLRGHYGFSYGKLRMNFTLQVYNLFDRRNVEYVNSVTGLPNTIIVQDEDVEQYRSTFLTYEETYKYNPTAYSAPRKIKLGLDIVF